MANDLRMANAGVNSEADALSDQLDAGYLRLYSVGSGRPATADTAVTDQVLLAELRYNATASGAAVAGVLTFSAFTSDASANNDGTATWYRALKADGTTSIMDGSVGDDSGTFDLELNDPDIQAGTEVAVTSFTHTVPKT